MDYQPFNFETEDKEKITEIEYEPIELDTETDFEYKPIDLDLNESDVTDSELPADFEFKKTNLFDTLSPEDFEGEELKPFAEIEDLGKIAMPGLEYELGEEYEELSYSESFAYPFVRLASNISRAGSGLAGLGAKSIKNIAQFAHDRTLESAGIDYEPLETEFLDELIETYDAPEEHLPLNRYSAELQQRRRLDAYDTNTAVGILSDIGDAGIDLTSLLIQMKLIGGAKDLAPTTTLAEQSGIQQLTDRIATLGLHGATTTPGGTEERLQAAITRIGYNITPYLANATGATGLTATAVDTGLNTILTSPTYIKAFEEAGGLNEEFLSIAVPQMVMDIGMAWNTRGLPENIALERFEERADLLSKEYDIPRDQAKQTLENLREEFNKIERTEFENNVLGERMSKMNYENERINNTLREIDENIETLKNGLDEVSQQQREGMEQTIERLEDEKKVLLNQREKIINESERIELADDLEDDIYRSDTFDGDVDPVNRQEIEEHIRIDMELPFRYGRIDNRRAEAKYNRIEEVIRTRDYSNNEVTAHEVGHHLVNKLDLEVERFDVLPEILRQEGLNELYPLEIHHHEGAAEFFKYWFNYPGEAALKSPEFTRHVEQKLDENPDIREEVKDLQDMMSRWEHQSASDREAGRMTRRDYEQRELFNLKDRFNAAWIDDATALNKAMKEAGVERNELSITDDPIALYRLFDGIDDKVHTFLTKQAYDSNFRPTTNSLKDILAPVRTFIGNEKKAGEFEIYTLSKHSIEREARLLERELEENNPLKEDIDKAIVKDDMQTLSQILQNNFDRIGPATGIRIDDLPEITDYIIEYEKEHPEFRETLENLVEYQNNLVDYATDKGMFSQEAAENIKDAYEFHVPLYRLFGEQKDYFDQPIGGNKFGDLPSPIKRAYGSTRIIKDPIRSIIRDTEYILRQSDKNEIMSTFVNTITEQEGTGWLLEKISEPIEVNEIVLGQIRDDLTRAGLDERDLDNMDLSEIAKTYEEVQYSRLSESRENIVTVRENGEANFYQLHPEIYRFIEGFKKPQLGLIGQALQAPANLFKRGAVMAPRFPLRNIVRDEFREALYSNDFHVPGKTFIDGFLNLIDMDKQELDNLFQAAGGSRAGWYSLLDNIESPEKVQELLVEEKIGLNPMEYLGALTRWSEDTRRKGFFIDELKGVDFNKLGDKEYREQVVEAALEARGGILEDYGIKGYLSEEVGRYVPFFEAQITGLRHGIEKHGTTKELALRGIKGLFYITLPTLGLYYHNRDKEEYQELPQFRKDYFFNYVTDEGNLFSIPKPFQPGLVYGTVPERFMEYLDTEDPQKLEDLYRNLFNLGMPTPSPAHLIPYVELMFGQRLQTETPIVPEGEQDIIPKYQYGEHTSEISKLMGETFNFSPRIIDHLIRGQTASLGDDFINLSNWALGTQDFTETLASITGAYQEGLSSPASVHRIYDEISRKEKIINTYEQEYFDKQLPEHELNFTQEEYNQAIIEHNILTSTRNELNNLRNTMEEIRNHLDKGDEERRESLDEINGLMIDISRRTLNDLDIINYPGY